MERVLKKPFDYQVEGIEFLVGAKSAILADEPGLGKTIQATLAAQELGTKTLIVCPASLKINWAREILDVEKDPHIMIVDGGNIYTYHDGEGTRYVIVNYDLIIQKQLLKHIVDWQAHTAILDEAHYIKNTGKKRTNASLKISGSVNNVFLLTGTPVMNRPEELFNLLKAINHPLGQNWYSYVRRYCAAKNITFYKTLRDSNGNVIYDRYGKPEKRKISYLDTKGASNLEELGRKLRGVYLRRTKDILGDKLPAKIIDNREVELNKEWREKYNNVWDEYIEYLKNVPEGQQTKNITNVQLARHLVEIQKLKQVASQAKLERIVEDALNVIDAGEKVIIFTQYTETLKLLKDQFKKNKIKAVSLDGRNNQKQRQATVDSFQNEEATKVFIGNIKAAGVGLNLYAGSQVYFCDMEWTPGLHTQAEDRAHRNGQTKLVNVYYYIAKDTIDEDIVELLEKKKQIIKTILEGGKVDDRDITKKAISKAIKRAQVINSG